MYYLEMHLIQKLCILLRMIIHFPFIVHFYIEHFRFSPFTNSMCGSLILLHKCFRYFWMGVRNKNVLAQNLIS